MAADAEYFFHFFIDCPTDNTLDTSFFLKIPSRQTIGDALFGKIGQMDVIVKSIEATSQKTSSIASSKSHVDVDTQGGVLSAFGTRVVYVTVEPREANVSTGSEPESKNAFEVLMAIHKQYKSLPPARTENNSKDRLFNRVLDMFKDNEWGFTPIQVGTTGVFVVKTLTDTLWFLDPHIAKLNARGIHLPDYNDFHGFNDWKLQKKKEPKLMAEELEYHMSKMVDMLSIPYFLNQNFASLQQKCNKLVDGMTKYMNFLKRQQERSAENHHNPEPVRSLSDSWAFKQVSISPKVEDEYTVLHEELHNLAFDEPLFLFSIQPSDRIDRRHWLQNMALPYPVKLYTHTFGNYFGNFNFVWRVDNQAGSANGDLEAIQSIKDNLPIFSTRAMRKDFIDRYSKKVGASPAVLRDVFRYLTQDSSATETSDQSDVDKRVAEFLVTSDDTELFRDLRRNNGAPKDTRLDPFWNALAEHLEESAVVHERRHSDKMYMPIDISVESLITTVADKLPEGTPVPSRSWVSFNFWPSNPYLRAAMCYTGRFKIRHAVQRRLTRAKHPDSGYVFHQFKMMKEMVVKHRADSEMICLDDKSIVPIGEPGCRVSTVVRAHNKSLIPVGAKLSALDHDFHVHGAVPSVLFQINIPKHVDDSFYDGTVNITLKDKVFMRSTAIRHATETVKILRSHSSADGVSLDKPLLFIYTDGGPDHRTNFWTVQMSTLAIFIALDLDMVVSVRTAPSHSYCNPAERCMSLLNIALQNTAVERSPMEPTAEFKVKSMKTLKLLRDATTRQPQLKTAVVKSLEAPLELLKVRFSQLKLHGDPVQTHDAATPEELDLMEEILGIFDEEPPHTSYAKAAEAPPKLKEFMNGHCRSRHYSFQVRKCDSKCWYCCMNPPRLTERRWLPDPCISQETPGEYRSFNDVYGTETTDHDRPGRSASGQTSEKDRLHKPHLTAAKVRSFVICCECGKRRVVYSKERFGPAQCQGVEVVQEQLLYVCGSTLFPEGHIYADTIFVRENLECSSNIETTYYAGVTQKFTDICIHCGDCVVLRAEECQPLADLNNQYAIVRPICSRYWDAGKQPVVRNALKMKMATKK